MGAKFAIITGGNSGLGLHLAKALFTLHDYSIVLACRNREKAEQAVREVQQVPVGTSLGNVRPSVRYIQLDLTKNKSIRDFVQEFGKICLPGSLHLLVNNAGVMNHPYQLSPEGVEMHFASNYLGHFYLTNLLTTFFAPKARILNVTSSFYEKATGIPPINVLTSQKNDAGLTPFQFYSISKLAMCLHTLALNHRLKKGEATREIKVVAVRPGFVRGTELGRHTNPVLRFLATPLIWWFSIDLDEGISTLLHCIECEGSELESGKLYHNKKAIQYKETVNPEDADKLWELSSKLINTNLAQ